MIKEYNIKIIHINPMELTLQINKEGLLQELKTNSIGKIIKKYNISLDYLNNILKEYNISKKFKICKNCWGFFSIDYYYKHTALCKSCYRKRYPVLTFKMAKKEREQIEKKQNHRCLICGIILSNSLHIDHDHKTNKFRGLLCSHCNIGLGYFKDNPLILLKAAKYLEINKENI